MRLFPCTCGESFESGEDPVRCYAFRCGGRIAKTRRERAHWRTFREKIAAAERAGTYGYTPRYSERFTDDGQER